MTSRDFAFWLQGFFEVTDPKEINEKQTDLIKRHLNLVFKHEIDPSYSDDPKVQEELNQIHSGNTPLPPPNNKPSPGTSFQGYGQDPNDPNTVLRC